MDISVLGGSWAEIGEFSVEDDLRMKMGKDVVKQVFKLLNVKLSELILGIW